jgi:hypothetical protein
MAKPNGLALIAGLSGLGMILLGGIAYYRQRKYGGVMGFGHAANEAPIINSYSDGNMRTILRGAPNMPIEQRLAEIQKKVRSSVQDPEMRKIALQVTSRCPERDGLCEAQAIYNYVKRKVRYTGDVAPIIWEDGNVEGIDLYQSARRTLEFGGGDCDDQAILNSTLLSLNGITPILRVVRQKGDNDWSHIYAGGLLPKGTGNRFIALDTTLPGIDRFGIELPVAKIKDFPA